MRSAESFFSRKHHYSVKIQAVCDFSTKIRYVTIGNPGSVHDARIFNDCPLSTTTHNFFSDMQYLAADSAYKLTPFIITPYRRNSRMTTADQRRRFNRYFSKYRVRIEHCFGRLKEKFGSLKELRFRLHSNDNYVYMCDWILVCCILYNIVVSNNEYEGDTILNDGNNDEIGFLTSELNNDDDVVGELKRQMIFDTHIA